MPLDARELDRRVKKLRKSLKTFSKDPTVEDVHDLRTRTRRVESIVDALAMDRSTRGRKLTKQMKVLRKRAGKVRDMDVLTTHVLQLGVDSDPGCVVRLAHHLGVQRYKHAAALHSVVQDEASQMRKRLKQSRRKLDRALQRYTEAATDLAGTDKSAQAPMHAMSEALTIARELAAVPRLDRNNLHPYRIEVKRLRYILEMADSNGQQKAFVNALKKVQDLIGEWHDWVELSAIAQELLAHDGCPLLKKIDETAQQKFAEALRTTEQMRRQYLRAPERRSKSARSRKSKQAFAPGPVLVATAEIAA